MEETTPEIAKDAIDRLAEKVKKKKNLEEIAIRYAMIELVSEWMKMDSRFIIQEADKLTKYILTGEK